MNLQKHNTRQSEYDDEIDLRDLVLVLVRRKWLILGVFVLGMALAAGYLAMTPKTYTATRTLAFPGWMQGEDNTLGGDFFSAKVRDYAREIHSFPADGKMEMRGSVPRGNPNLLEVELRGPNIGRFAELFDGIEGFLSDTDEFRQLFNLQRTRVVQELNLDAELLKNYRQLLDEWKSGQMPHLGFDLFSAIRAVTLRVSKNEGLLSEFGAMHSFQYLEQEHMITEVRPKTLQILVLAAMSSLMIGVFAAFFAEFTQGVRQRERESKDKP